MLMNRSSFHLIVLGFGIIAISDLSVAAATGWAANIFGPIEEFFGVPVNDIGDNQRVISEEATASNGKIVFWRQTPADGTSGKIYIVDPNSRGTETLIGSGIRPVWKPDGSAILFLDPASQDGVNPSSAELKLMDPNGANVRSLTTRTFTLTNISNENTAASWSPDGSKIAFIKMFGGVSQHLSDIWIMNADGSGQSQITNSVHRDDNPSWSSEGTKIVFDRVVNGDFSFQIFTVTTTNPTETALTSVAGTNSLHPSWSPDGTKIVFQRDFDIYVMSSQGAIQQRLTSDGFSFGDTSPVFSPDGTTISWSSASRPQAQTTAYKIYTMPAVGNPVPTAQIKLISSATGTGIDSTPSWAPTSSAIASTGKIVFYRGSGASATIYIVDPAVPGGETVIGSGIYPVWKPDGSAILFTDPTSHEGTNANTGELN